MNELFTIHTKQELQEAHQANIDERIRVLMTTLSQDTTPYTLSFLTQENAHADIKILLAAEEAYTLPQDIIDDFIDFHIHSVREDGCNFRNRKDCLDVATRAVQHFSQSIYADKLACEVFTTECDSRNTSGYGYHAINIFEIWTEETDSELEQESVFLAVDFTASYNMDAEKGRYAIFTTQTHDRSKLETAIEKLNR